MKNQGKNLNKHSHATPVKAVFLGPAKSTPNSTLNRCLDTCAC